VSKEEKTGQVSTFNSFDTYFSFLPCYSWLTAGGQVTAASVFLPCLSRLNFQTTAEVYRIAA
jgi:hypothetical protein